MSKQGNTLLARLDQPKADAYLKFLKGEGTPQQIRRLDQRVVDNLIAKSTPSSLILTFLSPKQINAATISDSVWKSMMATDVLPPNVVDSFSSTILEDPVKSEAIVANSHQHLDRLSTETLRLLLTNVENAKHIETLDLQLLMKQATKCSLLSGEVFAKLPALTVLTAGSPRGTYGQAVQRLPEDVFRGVTTQMHEDFYRYMTPEQARNFQLDLDLENEPSKVHISLRLLSYKAIEALPAAVFVAYFTHPWADPLELLHMQEWRWWKRIPIDSWRAAVKAENADISEKIRKSAYKVMSREQRQTLLDHYGGEPPKGTCASISKEIFSGKPSRYLGLALSAACWEAIQAKPGMRMRALIYGAVDPAAIGDLGADEIGKYKMVVKTDTKEQDMNGVLVLEAMRVQPKGSQYLEQIFSKENEGALEACEKHLDFVRLERAPWLQQNLPRACITRIPRPSYSAAEKMSQAVWEKFSRKQITSMIKGKQAWARVSEKALAGLAANKAFAKLATHTAEKDAPGGTVVRTDSVLGVLPDAAVARLGEDFVANVPEQPDYKHGLMQALPRMHASALRGVNGTWIRSRFADVNAVPAHLFGQASDSLEAANSLPASLGTSEVMALPDDRFAGVSALFVSRLSDFALAALNAKQVAQMPAKALALLSTDRAKHIDAGLLSEEQKAALGSACPKVADSAAPAPSSVVAVLKLAAAAAGSAAVLL